MLHPTRDRISVDLQGLKGALLSRAQALGTSPSNLLRAMLAEALAAPVEAPTHQPPGAQPASRGDRVRLHLRMQRADAVACLQAAQRAGMNPGDFVAGLVAGVPVPTQAGNRPDLLAALVAASAETSTLSRNIHHLTALLRQGAFRAAQEYRPMLDTLGTDVRAHLALTSRAMASLQLQRRPCTPQPPTSA